MTSIPVEDVNLAFKFYTEILGFQQHTYLPEYSLAIVASSKENNNTLLMLEPNNNVLSKNYQNGLYQKKIPVITFSVQNIYKEFHRLKDLGITFIKEPTKQDWGIESVFDDTSGNYIQLIEQ